MDEAQSLIAKYLDEVDIVYPPERKARLRVRMQRFWNGESIDDRIPYAALHMQPATDIPASLHPYDRELIAQLSAIARHGRDWDDDYYPALFPGVRQLTLPSYFGCVERSVPGSQVKPAIAEAQHVYNLPRLDMDDPDVAGGEMLARMRHWRRATAGRISLYETDMQGPFSVASQIWGVESFLLACYDSPDEVHFLLDACTDVLIEYTRRMFEIAEGDLIPLHCHPFVWYPRQRGMALSEDLLAVISPDVVRSYINPQLCRVAEAFGGVAVHTCGNMNPTIPALCEVPGLVGLNFSSSETDLQLAMQRKRSNVRILCHGSPISAAGLPRRSPLAHAVYVGACAREAGQQICCLVSDTDGTLRPSLEPALRRALSR